jgi:glutamate dehydrogenase/leucine dehydrogenase
MLTLWAGALAGVIAGNYLEMGMLGTPPFFAGAGEAATIGGMASSTMQAASRVVVVGSGVLGAWAADYLYRR